MRVVNDTGGKYYRTELEVILRDGRCVTIELLEFDQECCDGHYERSATRIVADAILALGKL